MRLGIWLRIRKNYPACTKPEFNPSQKSVNQYYIRRQ